MIDVDDLLSLVRNYNPKCNEALLRGAYAYADRMHEGQTRASGEPYFTHPVAVAAILTEQRLDDATIATALLHDTIEDTKGTYSEVEKLFGHDVAELVDGVTKLTNLELSSRETKQAENFRKLFMAMSKDLRVILVKLADRAAWGCSGCGTSWRTWRFPCSTPMRASRSCAGSWCCRRNRAM